MSKQQAKTSAPAPTVDERRGFVSKALAVVIGGVVSVFPAAAGLFTFLDPLRSRNHSGSADEPGRLVRIAPLDALPDDGLPRQFPVIADRDDAWTHFANATIGVVYLRREKGSDQIQAFNATCPHAGCMVSYKPEARLYECPCHTSAFDIDGVCKFGPSPRALDELATEVQDKGEQREVWVRFVDFHSGIEKKKPKT